MQTSGFEKWEKDPRLQSMEPEKIMLLKTLANRLALASPEQKTAEFLKINQEARNAGMKFNAEEQELLAAVLTENMSPEEKAKVQMIRKLASRMRRPD